MTRSTPVLALFAVGIAGTAIGSPAVPHPPTSDELTIDELSRLDVRGTATSIASISGQVQALSAETLAQASESLRILSVNCPYTRSALQLPFALHATVMSVDPGRLDPFVQRDWETLQLGLATHVALLDALEVDLREPVVGDYLHGKAPGLLIHRDTLLNLDDPILGTAQLVDQITALAKQVDGSTKEVIDLHSDRVEAATGVGRPCPRGPWSILPGQPWTLGMQLGGWHDALRRVEPFVQDPEARIKIEAMLDLLDAYGEASFATR